MGERRGQRARRRGEGSTALSPLLPPPLPSLGSILSHAHSEYSFPFSPFPYSLSPLLLLLLSPAVYRFSRLNALVKASSDIVSPIPTIITHFRCLPRPSPSPLPRNPYPLPSTSQLPLSVPSERESLPSSLSHRTSIRDVLLSSTPTWAGLPNLKIFSLVFHPSPHSSLHSLRVSTVSSTPSLSLLKAFLPLLCDTLLSVITMSTNGLSNGTSSAVRAASHAGSWYTKNPRDLSRELQDWLGAVGEPIGEARAIIAPHAGYSYCGATAAHAFNQIVPEKVHRIFVLGPSHVVSLSGCALTTCSKYRTPLGDININRQITDELYASGQFEWMGRKDEETEHSIEMQLPFIAKVMENQPSGSYTLIPVLVGSLSGNKQATYGSIFARYLEDPHNLFVISSDFCHWGSRFRFTPYDQSSSVPIFEQISNLDKQGMEAITRLQPEHFNAYLKKTSNTICGRNPICVMLNAAEHFRQANNHTHEFRFLRYSQSNQVRNPSDSSVSYAAGALFIHPK